jgi:hypothetical protein
MDEGARVDIAISVAAVFQAVAPLATLSHTPYLFDSVQIDSVQVNVNFIRILLTIEPAVPQVTTL